MAHIEINRYEFDELVGEKISDERLREQASFLGAHWSKVDDEKWDVEVYPNRPDLLSVEGLSRAYRGFFNIETGPAQYNINDAEIKLEVDSSVASVRPYIGGAVVRNLDLDERTINGLIQLQEKLHQTVGRRRDKIAIGLHDMSPLEPPFRYMAVAPEDYSFKPLDHDEQLHLGEILEAHAKGQEYSWILDDEEKYPIIVDSDDQVLSFPPIINNQLTEVTTDTTDVFIDVTGKDKQTVRQVLAILSAALAERGGELEAVTVDGQTMPDLSPETVELDPDYVRSISGLDISDKEIVDRLEMMNFGAEKSSGSIQVDVPAYRIDIMHSYDLIEDIVIAHGYTNIDPVMPEVDQIGGQKQIEEYTDLLRTTLIGSGAMEAHTYILSSPEKLFDRMDIEHEPIAEMENALTEEYTAVRNWLMPSLMDVLKRNRHHSYPQDFFEVADVAHLDDSNVGASNQRKLAYVHADSDAGYIDVRGVVQLIERDLGVELDVKKFQKNCFKDNRSAEVYLDGEKVGVLGELTQKVIDNWGLKTSAAALELDIDKIVELM